MTTTYAITLLLRSAAQPAEVEELAAELVADARAHLRPGERLELERVAAQTSV